MKKFVLVSLLLTIVFVKFTNAQCGTIMVNAAVTQYPDTITNLPLAVSGNVYNTTIQFYAPSSISGFTVNSITLNSISGLPTGFTYSKFPVSGILNAGTSGCLIIQSVNVTASNGTYPLIINATASLQSLGNIPVQITGYKIIVGTTSGPSISDWYFQTDWINSTGGSSNRYINFLMKDSLSKYVNSANTVTRGANVISAGSIIDARDPLIDYSNNPTIKISKTDSAALDSVYFTYLYVRNTDSNTISVSVKQAVVDTLLITWYKSTNLRTGSLTSGEKFSLPAGNWDSVHLTQTNYFKRDTILLTRNDSTTVLNLSGGFENSWQIKSKIIKVPDGMCSSYGDTSKLFGYSLQFRSGVIGADTGIMVYQQNPSTLPAGTKRPNYFGYLYLQESYQGAWFGMTDQSLSSGIEVLKSTAYVRTSSWLGHVPGNVFIYKRAVESGFHINSYPNTTPIISYNVSDTVICKGNSVSFNLSNCNLFLGTNDLGTGSISQTPLLTTSYQVKRNGNYIASITITVNDSLNIQRITTSDTLQFCGYSKKFALGVTSNYTGSKSFLWSRNDTILFGNTLPVDSFTSAGKYTVMVYTPTGCYNEHSFYVNKLNSSFNPDFSVNRQLATAPPFDFTFSNNTTPLTDYNFTWNWGDGNTAQNSNLINFYTYTNNGQYNVKLVAQHKITGCKDSILKAGYITCTGGTSASLSFTTSKTNPACKGAANGSITINVTGGTPPYQYKINNGSFVSSNVFANLTAGIYSLQLMDAQSNTVSKSDTLVDPALVSVGGITGSNGVPVGSIQTYSISSQSGVVYTWNIINGTLLSGNGTNSVMVQWAAIAGTGKVIANINRNGCSAADTIIVSIGSNPLSFTSLVVNETCPGKSNGSISINASGGNIPYQYSLNNGVFQTQSSFNNLSAGVYLTKVKDAFSAVSQHYDTVKSGPGIIAGIINGPVNVQPGASSGYIIGQQTGMTYLWSATGGIIASGQGTNTGQVSWGATPGKGVVKVKLTSTAGCIDSSELSVTINSAGINSVDRSFPYQLYPNPTNDMINIRAGKQSLKGATVSIFDMLGRIVLTQQIKSDISVELSIADLNPGTYFVEVEKEGQISRAKLLKE